MSSSASLLTGGPSVARYANPANTWDAPGKVIINQDDLATLSPRVGGAVSPAPNLRARQLILLH